MNNDRPGLILFIVYCVTLAAIIGIAICACVHSQAYYEPIETEAVLESYKPEDDVTEEMFGPEEFVGPTKPAVQEVATVTDNDILVEEFEVVEPESVVEVEPIVEKAVEKIELPEIGSLAGDPAIYLAKTVWGEARGCSTIEKAAVVWCVLNRVDSELAYMPDDIISVITQVDGHGYFHFRGYNPDFPVTDEIYDIVVDVLARWELEKTGVENVGRVLPKEYLYFHGDGLNNHFRDEYTGGNRWDWSLKSPYE